MRIRDIAIHAVVFFAIAHYSFAKAQDVQPVKHKPHNKQAVKEEWHKPLDNPYELATQAQFAAGDPSRYDYVLSLQDVIDTVLTQCTPESGLGADDKKLLWGGRISPKGEVIVSMSSISNTFGTCVQTSMSQQVLPPPPCPECFREMGGFPIAFRPDVK